MKVFLHANVCVKLSVDNLWATRSSISGWEALWCNTEVEIKRFKESISLSNGVFSLDGRSVSK